MNRMTSVLLCTLLAAGGAASAAPVVSIDSGPIAGTENEGVIAFKGIPYAAPPVGDNRWRAPQPVAPWRDARQTIRYGALCKQIINPKDNGVGPPPDSEDCLTLNVFAPKPVKGKKSPVMYWIHGGGYVNGSGTAPLYDGTELAKQGVVVVTINYRLGRFGFFAHPALTRENSAGPLGNYGLMDMIAGLQWVKRNIAAFGGDPRNVTIFGESAGAGAVTILMTSPPAHGLFHKAIAESAPARMDLAYLNHPTVSGVPSAENLGSEFVRSLGVTTDDVRELRAIPAERIIAAGDPDLQRGGGPIVDGTLVPERTDLVFLRGQQAKVPYLLGTNALEFPFTPITPGPFARFASMSNERRTTLIAAYGGEEVFNTNIISDVIFTEAASLMANAHAKLGSPTYLYRFSVLSRTAPPMIKAAPHASDRQYVFKTLQASPWPTDERDAKQAALMSAYWVAFAQTGDPNGGKRPTWPRYARQQPKWFNFTNEGPHSEDIAHPKALREIARRYDDVVGATRR